MQVKSNMLRVACSSPALSADRNGQLPARWCRASHHTQRASWAHSIATRTHVLAADTSSRSQRSRKFLPRENRSRDSARLRTRASAFGAPRALPYRATQARLDRRCSSLTASRHRAGPLGENGRETLGDGLASSEEQGAINALASDAETAGKQPGLVMRILRGVAEAVQLLVVLGALIILPLYILSAPASKAPSFALSARPRSSDTLCFELSACAEWLQGRPALLSHHPDPSVVRRSRGPARRLCGLAR